MLRCGRMICGDTNSIHNVHELCAIPKFTIIVSMSNSFEAGDNNNRRKQVICTKKSRIRYFTPLEIVTDT